MNNWYECIKKTDNSRSLPCSWTIHTPGSISGRRREGSGWTRWPWNAPWTLLTKEGLLVFEKDFNRTVYRANMEDLSLRHIKIAYNLYLLRKKGAAELLLNGCSPLRHNTVREHGQGGERPWFGRRSARHIQEQGPPIEELGRGWGARLTWSCSLPRCGPDRRAPNRAFYLDVILDGIPLHGTSRWWIEECGVFQRQSHPFILESES